MALLKIVRRQNPREIAVSVLARREEGAFVEDLLEQALAGSDLSTADRGLCQELVYGIVRRQSTLDWLVARKTQNRVQKRDLQNLLRMGLYQILWLDRIPPHAAVHETVELARQRGLGPQSGFVNAVLRGYLRELDATRRALEELKATDPATGYSHPAWLVERWQKRWGPADVARLMEWNNSPPGTFARVNTLKTEPGKLLEQWRVENVEYDFVRQPWFEEGLVFQLKAHPPLHRLASFQHGLFYIQDPSTLLAVHELDPKPGETILDLCAAPGGKLTYAAQRMRNEGKLVASDILDQRLELVRQNCLRLGVTCAVLSGGDAGLSERPLNPAPDPQHRVVHAPPATLFDRVLVDAPCSNTGVMRRRVDLRWRIRSEEISRLRRLQSDLLVQAARKVRKGGVILYSTCSLEPEENEVVRDEFLKSSPEFALEQERRLTPFEDGTDGAFVARLRREA